MTQIDSRRFATVAATKEAESFQDMLAEQMQRAPWFAVSLAAHAIGILMLWLLIPAETKPKAHHHAEVVASRRAAAVAACRARRPETGRARGGIVRRSAAPSPPDRRGCGRCRRSAHPTRAPRCGRTDRGCARGCPCASDASALGSRRAASGARRRAHSARSSARTGPGRSVAARRSPSARRPFARRGRRGSRGARPARAPSPAPPRAPPGRSWRRARPACPDS